MTTQKSDGWVLCAPNGRIYPETFATSRDECWGLAFERLYHDHVWMRDFWKQWNASMKAAREHGYTMVRVNLQKVDIGIL